eukprot:12250714-Karenia_brevis.AAC.1
MKQRWMSQILQTKLTSPNGQDFKRELRKERQIKTQKKDQRKKPEHLRGRREQQNPHQMKRWPHHIKHGEWMET